MNTGNRPLVGVTADNRPLPDHPHKAQLAGDSYLAAAADGAGVYPVVLPSMPGFDVLDVLDRLDGLLVTGSPSNLDPRHYGGRPAGEDARLDRDRDAAVLALIPAAIEAGIPVLAICRGLQEMNVAFGGSLLQDVQRRAGSLAHSGDPDAPLEDKYRPAHPVRFAAGGLLEKITGGRDAVVNSLHAQGIDRLGEGLVVEAVAEDGLVEAFSMERARAFALAVQWHPEWNVSEDPVSRSLFRAFGNACRARRMRHWGKKDAY